MVQLWAGSHIIIIVIVKNVASCPPSEFIKVHSHDILCLLGKTNPELSIKIGSAVMKLARGWIYTHTQKKIESD